MNVVQTGEGSALQRHKQQLRETAAKDEARADELRRTGTDDLFTAVERLEDAADNQTKADTLKDQAQRLHRRGQRQNKRGLENLANGSDRISEGFSRTEKGLEELKGSLDGLEAASGQKEQGVALAQEGLTQQAVENGRQGADLHKFSQLNKKDARLDGEKAERLEAMEQNLGQREQGLQRQGEQLDAFLIAGENFQQASAVKAEGFATLQEANAHIVEGEALNDAAETEKLKQGWSQAQQVRHQDTSADLALSSLYQSLKAKAEALGARYHKDQASRVGGSAEELTAQANSLRAESAALAQQARVLEQSGQCHVAIGRQMQCLPWSYCQGVCLERQGCAELAEAQRLKGLGQEKRAEAQELSLQAEELRAKAEDALARGEELEVKSHGSQTRAQLLDSRAQEHREAGVEAGQDAEAAGLAAGQYEAAANQERAMGQHLHGQGVAQLQDGFVAQEEALQRQEISGGAFGEELELESELTSASQEMTGDALKTVGKEISFIGRGNRLLSQLRQSQAREGEAQAKVGSGIELVEAGLGASQEAQARGVQATELLEQARELELEGLRLQNRGQKMLLEARPKLAGAARLSAESFDAASKAERQEEEAARLIETGNQKIAAATVLREKAARYRELAQ
jgi:hypothetical protein